MLLHGSCHCQSVKFSLESKHPYPFNLCYCSICRKTNGGGGYAINLSGDSRTLEVDGEQNIAVYRARIQNAETGTWSESHCERRFCKLCGSGLWAYSAEWPELVHPFASAIDTELPAAPEHTHLMLGSKASWVPVRVGPKDQRFEHYPEESIEAWHQRLGLEC